MFKSIYDTVIDKISSLNPIRPFIKYALDQTLNEFLSKELTLDDFKNGPLNLNNIEINENKINNSHLISSPYIIHHGVIGNLRITLPALSQISTQSIQIHVSDVQVTLKPNKKFGEKFKEKMMQIHQMGQFYVEQKELEGEISEDGPVDFFKQLLKKIIINIKVKINNAVIKLYMNTPDRDASHPQYYAMLRIPAINFEKKEEKEIKKTEVESLKFNVLVPQISLHLLREDIKFPDYPNIPYKEGDYPFVYPPVSHPGTILLIGVEKVPANIQEQVGELRKTGVIKNYNFSNIQLSLTTDFKKKIKQLNIKINLENLEAMVNPVQLKILSRFVVQILQFKKVLSSIIEDLKHETNGEINLKKKSSETNSVSQSNDFFSSLVMSIQQYPGNISINRSREDIYTSIMKKGDKNIRESISNFNKQCENQLMREMRKNIEIEHTIHQSMQIQPEFHAIKFTNSFLLSVDVARIQCFILKYLSVNDYFRFWNEQQDRKINQKIGCSYYMLTIGKTNFQHRSNDKITEGSFKKLKLYNIKLKGEKTESSVDDYFDVESSMEFYSMDQRRFSEDKSKNNIYQPRIHEYQLGQNEHYCVQQVLRICQTQSEPREEEKDYKKYTFLPYFSENKAKSATLYKPGLSFKFNKAEKSQIIHLQIITVSLNFEIAQDFLNIFYPIFTYRRLSDLITYKRGQVQVAKNEKKKHSLLESHYEFRMDYQMQQDEKIGNRKNVLVIEVEEVKLGLRKGANVGFFDQLIKKNKDKIYDHDSYNHECFCNVQEKVLYLEIDGLHFKGKLPEFKVSCKKIQAGVLEIKQSTIKNVSSMLVISPEGDQKIKVFKQVGYVDLFSVYVPMIQAKIQEEILQSLIQMALDGVKIGENLMSFQHYLHNEMMVIQHQSESIEKKTKKNQKRDIQFQVYVNNVVIQVLFLIARIQKLCVCNLNEEIIVKIGTLALGLNRIMKNQICEYRNNQIMLLNYGGKPKYQEIADCNMILEIEDENKTQYVFKNNLKDEFFKKIEKNSSSINIRIVKKETSRNSKRSSREPGSFSQRFQFKKQTNSIIEEEGQNQIISINILKNVKLYACNALSILQQKERIDNCLKYIQKTKASVEEMKRQTVMMMQRKGSCQIDGESVEFDIKTVKILVDVRPDFILNKEQEKVWERVYSCTRSVLVIDPTEVKFYSNKDKKTKDICAETGFEVYFLMADDRQIDCHPFLIDINKLNDLGFKCIMSLEKLFVKINMHQRENLSPSINLKLSIKSILGQCSLQTLILIKLHLDHFLKHHVHQQYGISLEEMYEKEEYCHLSFEEEENRDGIIIIDPQQGDQFIVEDLTDSLDKYQEKLNKKIDEENKFKMRTFIEKNVDDSNLNIDSLKIEKIHFRTYKGNDFDFNRSNNGMIQSGSGKRVKQKQEEDNRYLTIQINNIELRLSANLQKNILCTLTKIEKIKIYFSKQKILSQNNLKYLEQQIPQKQFIICQNEADILLIFDRTPESIYIKTMALRLKVGVTSELLTIMNCLKDTEKAIESSGWVKIYDSKLKKNKKKDENQNNEQRFLVIVPESNLKLSLQYENYVSLLDDQSILTTQLIINEELSNSYAINNTVSNWITKLLRENVGTLVSKTVLNILLKIISQIIAFQLNYLAKLFGLLNIMS